MRTGPLCTFPPPSVRSVGADPIEEHEGGPLLHRHRQCSWPPGGTSLHRRLQKEAEEHFYQPDHKHPIDLGYEPTLDMKSELGLMFADLLRWKDRIHQKNNF